MSRYLESRRETLPPAVADLAEQLADSGYKVTGPRLAVIKAATAYQGAFSVQELEQWLTERNESPGIASIFRTVRLLCDLNLVQRIHGLDECHRYSLGSGHGHHLVCTRCGAMVRFDNCGVQELVRELERRTGFRISAHLVEMFGLCSRCLADATAQVTVPQSDVAGTS
jgi:Fur family transcriptional regulator, ferric uptake regulator